MTEHEEKELTEEEKHHLRALKLFWEAHGEEKKAEQLDQLSPSFQRLFITMYHTWLERPEILENEIEKFNKYPRWIYNLRARLMAIFFRLMGVR